MPFDFAGDREARRKARQRGNPAYQRYRREEQEEFVIRVEPTGKENAQRSADNGVKAPTHDAPIGAAIQRPAAAMRTVTHNNPKTPTTPKSLKRQRPVASDALPIRRTPLKKPPVRSQIMPEWEGLSMGDEEPEQHMAEVRRPRASHGQAKKSKRRPHRRPAIDTEGLDGVLEQAPQRMTRSLARKIGVQHGKRRYGGGVQASQILRPVNAAGV